MEKEKILQLIQDCSQKTFVSSSSPIKDFPIDVDALIENIYEDDSFNKYISDEGKYQLKYLNIDDDDSLEEVIDQISTFIYENGRTYDSIPPNNIVEDNIELETGMFCEYSYLNDARIDWEKLILLIYNEVGIKFLKKELTSCRLICDVVDMISNKTK